MTETLLKKLSIRRKVI